MFGDAKLAEAAGDRLVLKPPDIPAVQELLREGRRVLPRGGGSKPALSGTALAARLGLAEMEMTAIAGVVEYDPDELTFTALAGTRLLDILPLLASNGQYLPFDPLFVEHGATLGGTVAAGASGSGRYHFGGVRDFILGVRYINSEGQLVRGGGKVVKNAAGFDLPKLMVGSMGSLGVLVELSFKVFPRPEAYATLRLECIWFAAGAGYVEAGGVFASGPGCAGFRTLAGWLCGLGAPGGDCKSLARAGRCAGSAAWKGSARRTAHDPRSGRRTALAQFPRDELEAAGLVIGQGPAHARAHSDARGGR